MTTTTNERIVKALEQTMGSGNLCTRVSKMTGLVM